MFDRLREEACSLCRKAWDGVKVVGGKAVKAGAAVGAVVVGVKVLSGTAHAQATSIPLQSLEFDWTTLAADVMTWIKSPLGAGLTISVTMLAVFIGFRIFKRCARG